MTLRILLILCGFLLWPAAAWTADGFVCADAQVEFSVVKNGKGLAAVITVSREAKHTTLQYKEVDFFGGACLSDAKGNPAIVYQVYCGGSACHDLDNWGIIDPQSLQLRLAPDDLNHEKAERMLGLRPLPHDLAKISVITEGRRLGLYPPACGRKGGCS